MLLSPSYPQPMETPGFDPGKPSVSFNRRSSLPGASWCGAARSKSSRAARRRKARRSLRAKRKLKRHPKFRSPDVVDEKVQPMESSRSHLPDVQSNHENGRKGCSASFTSNMAVYQQRAQQLGISVQEQRQADIVGIILKQLCSLSAQQARLHHVMGSPQQHRGELMAFCAACPVDIPIDEYVKRVQVYASCSVQCFTLALIYIDRIIASNPPFFVSEYTVHRLFITGVLVAAKFHDDRYMANSHYARVGGLSLAEVNALEVLLLTTLHFDAFVCKEDYDLYDSEIQRQLASRFVDTAGDPLAGGVGCGGHNDEVASSPMHTDTVSECTSLCSVADDSDSSCVGDMDTPRGDDSVVGMELDDEPEPS